MKLYWRIKKNGKWTWRAAIVRDSSVFKHIGVEGDATDETEMS